MIPQVVVRCNGCKDERRISPGEVGPADYPMCVKCGLPFVVVAATRIKALSIRQPWVWAILTQGKRIENRVWSATYRGSFLIHAAKACSPDEYAHALNWMSMRGVARVDLCPPLDELPRGCIVASANLVDVVPPRAPLDRYPRNVDQRWHESALYGYVLDAVDALPTFLPCRGMPGFFDPVRTV